MNERLSYRHEPKLRQIQLIELEILKKFDRICQENQLSYYVDWGTFLGAVRHQGFIPWDDDIDLAMPIEDYKKLLKILPTALDESLFFQSWQTDEEYVNVEGIKIRDRYSNLSGKSIFGEKNRSGVFIEVFPFYKTPSTKFLQKLQKLLFVNLVSSRYFSHPPKLKHRVRAWISRCVTLIIPFEKLESSIENMYRLTKEYRYRKTLHNTSKNWDFYYREETIFPLKRYPFEDMNVLGPADSDQYLTMMYGEYRTPPKVSDRVQTHMELERVKIFYEQEQSK